MATLLALLLAGWSTRIGARGAAAGRCRVMPPRGSRCDGDCRTVWQQTAAERGDIAQVAV
jgi:hypothetical protein